MKWLLVLLAACDPVYSLDVHVTNVDGTGLVDAALAITNCPNDGAENQSVLTDPHGNASVGGLGFNFPKCDITVAHVGFQPFETSFDEVCHGTVDDCDRVQSIDVVLDANP